MTWLWVLRRMVLLLIAVAPLVLAGFGSAADEILTNELVIKLVAAGLSEGVIVEKIQSTPSRFSVGTDDLIALKRAGVPDGVIQSMVRAFRGSQVVAPDPLGSRPVAPAPADPSAGGAPGDIGPVGPVMPGPGFVRPGLGVGLFPVFSPVRVEVKDTVIYMKDDKQIELEYTRGRVKQFGFVVYTSKLTLHDARAQLRVAEARPMFYVGANPTDVVLVRFKSDPKDNDRTFTIGKAMFFPYWSDVKQYVDTEDTVPVDFEKLPSGYYRVVPKEPLAPGEYAFLREGGGSGRAYDFGRD